MRALSPNHWTSREVPQLYSFACGYPVVPAPLTEKILLPPLNGLGTLMLFNGYSTKHSIMWKYLTLFIWSLYIWTVQFSSVTQLCPNLCDLVNRSTPGLPVHHQLLESTQTHVHRVGDAIQPSHPLSSPLLLHAVFPSIRVFSNESALSMRWPKDWSFSFNVSPSNEHPGLICFRMDWLDLLLSKGLSRVFSNTTVQKHQFFGAQLSLESNSHIHT